MLSRIVHLRDMYSYDLCKWSYFLCSLSLFILSALLCREHPCWLDMESDLKIKTTIVTEILYVYVRLGAVNQGFVGVSPAPGIACPGNEHDKRQANARIYTPLSFARLLYRVWDDQFWTTCLHVVSWSREVILLEQALDIARFMLDPPANSANISFCVCHVAEKLFTS